MISENEAIVYNRNKFAYYLVKFASFMIVVMLITNIQTWLMKISYLDAVTEYSWGAKLLTYLVGYAFAIHLLPWIGYSIIVKSDE